MAASLVADALWRVIAPRLPAHRPRLRGGPSARAGSGELDRHPLRAQDGHSMGVPAAGDGLWLRHALLATPARLAPRARCEPKVREMISHHFAHAKIRFVAGYDVCPLLHARDERSRAYLAVLQTSA